MNDFFFEVTVLTNTIKCQNWILAVRVELFSIFLSIMHISLDGT